MYYLIEWEKATFKCETWGEVLSILKHMDTLPRNGIRIVVIYY